MYYNPFAKNRYVPKYFGGYYRPINMLDRIVGRPDQMGILDYLLVVPFVLKALYKLSERKPILNAIIGVLTVPFIVAKFAIYIAVSPITFLAWIADKIITKNIDKYALSTFVNELNKLTVKELANQDIDSVEPMPLAKVNKLYDANQMCYSIKVNLANELVLVNYGTDNQIAIISKTSQNLLRLE